MGKVVGVCVPTNRRRCAEEFVDLWIPRWLSDPWCAQGGGVHLFMHEDSAEASLELRMPAGIQLTTTCHADISRTLGKRAWIIPKRSGACRSFPMYLAWKAGCDHIITLDDDCLPHDDEFLTRHLSAFSTDRWFRTIHGDFPRGVPYGDRGLLPVLLNHGLWTGIGDLDGPTALVRSREHSQVALPRRREVIASGLCFPLCAMNVCYRREAMPAAYNLLMGLEQEGLDRFDDIWSGLFLKRIADQLGMFITNGPPFVHHTKASDPFNNLRKEALGIQLHEYVWRHVAQADLSGCATVAECYARLATWLPRLSESFPEAPVPGDYFVRLGTAMKAWLGLFDPNPSL